MLPTIKDDHGRSYACYPIAILNFVVDSEGRILMLCPPGDQEQWEVPSGALEANESVLEGAVRESGEELGDAVRLRPVGAVHTQTVEFRTIPLISVSYLYFYEGGAIEPGSDMSGATVGWWSIDELKSLCIGVPHGQPWLFERAITLSTLWRTDSVNLERGRW